MKSGQIYYICWGQMKDKVHKKIKFAICIQDNKYSRKIQGVS